MSPDARRLEQRAKRLPAEDRERLAQRLLSGLEHDRLTRVEEAWILEAERRYRRWKRGLVDATSASKAIRDIRKEIRG